MALNLAPAQSLSMLNPWDDEKFQLTALAVASVSIVALLIILASRPPQEPQPLTANLQAPKSSRVPETPDLRSAIPDQAGAPITEKQVTPETKQETQNETPAMQTSPAIIRELPQRPPIIPGKETTGEKTEKFPEPKSERVHWPSRAVLSVSKQRPAYQRATIKHELPYGPLPNRKSEYRFPNAEPGSEPFFELPFDF
jgi:hypothetical protein